MNFTEKLYIHDDILKRYKPLMNPETGVDYDANELKSFETVMSWTIQFPDGKQMDIKLCTGASYDNDPLWAEGVLFDNGCELTHTEVMDRLETEFTCETNSDDLTLKTTYTVQVLAESRRHA